MPQPHVMIVGAGIGGLTAALALQHFGCRVSLFEQAPELSEVGAGLTLSPNATHVLEFLGLGVPLAKLASIPQTGGIRHYQTSQVLVSTERGDRPRQCYGANYYQIHRADLHGLLHRAVLANDPACLHLGHSFVSLDEGDSSVRASFANGRRFEADVLIGCDGVRSAVRDCLFDTAPPQFTGQVAWRGLVPADTLPGEVMAKDSALAIGPGRTFTHYYLRNRSLINYVGIVCKNGWEVESWTVRSDISELLAEYNDWHPHFQSIIGATPTDLCFKWALFDRDPLERWVSGRVGLLGDAAHPMLPFLGQGAAMAIEDAMILARCLAACDQPASALRGYEVARKDRANGILRRSRERGQHLQGDKPAEYNDQAQNRAGDTEIFGYNPVTVDIGA